MDIRRTGALRRRKGLQEDWAGPEGNYWIDVPDEIEVKEVEKPDLSPTAYGESTRVHDGSGSIKGKMSDSNFSASGRGEGEK